MRVPERVAKGQTMTAYAMILAVIAIGGFVTYEVLGQDTNYLATWGVDAYLTSS